MSPVGWSLRSCDESEPGVELGVDAERGPKIGAAASWRERASNNPGPALAHPHSPTHPLTATQMATGANGGGKQRPRKDKDKKKKPIKVRKVKEVVWDDDARK